MKGDDLDWKVQFDNLRQSIEDAARWAVKELSNEAHTRQRRLHKARIYLDDAQEQIEILEDMLEAGEAA